jgi:hypothetical protein
LLEVQNVKLLLALIVLMGTLAGPATPAVAADPYGIPVKGADASWPNCPKGMGIPSRRTKGLPMPRADAKFVILGLTNGPGFYPNPCIVRQVNWARQRGIWVGTYAMTTFPKPKQIRTYGAEGPWEPAGAGNRLRNAGYAQAQFNVATMERAGLTNTFIWVDVEPYPVAPWTSSQKRNKAVLDGVLRGYRDAGLDVGFYTSPGPWRDIIGSARYGLPEWRTAGGHPWSNTDYSDARRMCRVTSVQGGPILVAQWWDTKRDHDLLCQRTRTQTWRDRLFVWMSEDDR